RNDRQHINLRTQIDRKIRAAPQRASTHDRAVVTQQYAFEHNGVPTPTCKYRRSSPASESIRPQAPVFGSPSHVPPRIMAAYCCRWLSVSPNIKSIAVSRLNQWLTLSSSVMPMPPCNCTACCPM